MADDIILLKARRRRCAFASCAAVVRKLHYNEPVVASTEAQQLVPEPQPQRDALCFFFFGQTSRSTSGFTKRKQKPHHLWFPVAPLSRFPVLVASPLVLDRVANPKDDLPGVAVIAAAVYPQKT
jgi:hypothetical protein